MTPYYQDDLVTIYHGDWRGYITGGKEVRAILYIWPDGKMALQAGEDMSKQETQDMAAALKPVREAFLEGKPLFVSNHIEVRPVTYREPEASFDALDKAAGEALRKVTA
jgi:hypothetical protein